jgi:ribosomal protein L14E/L6E/L27E
MPIVYALTCKDPTKIYFGSSMNTKKERYSKHNYSWKKWKDGKGNYCASYELFEIGDVEIYIVMDCPDDISELELRQLEQIYLDNCECINIKKSYRSEGQIKEYNKAYQQTEKYKEYQKEYQQTDSYKQQKKEYQKEYRLKRKEAKIKNIV